MWKTKIKLLHPLLCPAIILALQSCATPPDPLADFKAHTPTTIMEAPAPGNKVLAAYPVAQVEQGKYLVELLGCGSCHTDGALIGMPNSARRLAGSRVGIAYSNPLLVKNPGVLYAPNLTPDVNTGIGAWSDTELLNMIRHGVDRHGNRGLAVMPFPAYTRLKDADAGAIVAYLRSLDPVSHQVPANVAEGRKAREMYIHFGVYSNKH
ncbi:c-type cytochrome [Pseudomaricurvus alcaniphilus]|uniref:c-type cytochrome n=1 Tax=Pseudomaricurvus alcaniphilus TaxID=1166482 RepID=UPI0014080F68|nr:c-type cytochrome [Pseudomaricurvus alcaniphilus]NHN38361.1 c-type cytochrome [Pseudomaricurvus alcaniphilus]